MWGSQYQLDTLSQGDVAEIVAYVERHPDILDEPRLEQTDVCEETGRRAVWPYFIHEGYGYYSQGIDTAPS